MSLSKKSNVTVVALTKSSSNASISKSSDHKLNSQPHVVLNKIVIKSEGAPWRETNCSFSKKPKLFNSKK